MSTTYRDRIAASKSKLRSTAEPVAAALALAALAGSAQAATIYTMENPQPYVTNYGGLAFNPFTGSYLEDTRTLGAFPILAANCGGSSVEHTGNVSFYQGDPSSFPSWVTGGEIPFYTSLAPAGTVLDGSTSFGQTEPFGYTNGAPSTSQPNYFAYKIEQGGDTYYGWVEFSMVPVTDEYGTNNYAMATRFALSDKGESMIVGVPEPTSFMFSIVAGGLLLTRRKR
jgi:hypothetical protein